MAHREHFDFFEQVRTKFPGYFSGSSVLDIGSLDINGSNRYLFEDCKYVGLDIGPGKNVDVVCIAHEYAAPDGSFDAIISSNCLEHDMYYQKTLANALRLLRAKGLLAFVCKTILDGCNERTGEHGTTSSDTFSSPLTSSMPGWNTYYKNLVRSDVELAISPRLNFPRHEITIDKRAGDIRFWGIKCES